MLLGERPIPKIADFGTSKAIQTLIQSTPMAGTEKHAAPELLKQGSSYGEAVDIYSIAPILFEMFSGVDAFKGYSYHNSKYG